MLKTFYNLVLLAASASAINIEAVSKANALITVVPPTPTTTLASSVFDLTSFKIQLPYSCSTSNGVTSYSFTSGYSCEVTQPALASLNNA